MSNVDELKERRTTLQGVLEAIESGKLSEGDAASTAARVLSLQKDIALLDQTIRFQEQKQNA